MLQVLTLPKPFASLAMRPTDRNQWSDDQYWAFCLANPNLRIERSAEGEIMVAPPPGGESSYRESWAFGDLIIWARRDGRGKGFNSNLQYFLPDGASLAPDASWVSNENLARLTKEERKKFLRLVPEFVIEVMSPSDRLKPAKAKMEQWIANGVQLAWLIDGDRETVHIYRPGRPAEVIRHGAKLAGEGPVAGFVLSLKPIWRGL